MDSRKHAWSYLRFIRGVGEGLLKDFPEAKATFQPSPTDNHCLWVLGHLAGTDAWIGGLVGAKLGAQPQGWDKLFGMGSRPLPDPKVYPRLSEVRSVFDAHRAVLLNWLEAAPVAALEASLKEQSHGFGETALDAVYKIGWHEGWHFGQLAGVRKALALPPLVS